MGSPPASSDRTAGDPTAARKIPVRGIRRRAPSAPAAARALESHAPTCSADESNRRRFRLGCAAARHVDECNAEGQTTVMVTHSLDAASHASRVLFLRATARLREGAERELARARTLPPPCHRLSDRAAAGRCPSCATTLLPRLAQCGNTETAACTCRSCLQPAFMAMVYFGDAAFVYNESFGRSIPNGGNIQIPDERGVFPPDAGRPPAVSGLYLQLPAQNRSRELALYAILRTGPPPYRRNPAD